VSSSNKSSLNDYNVIINPIITEKGASGLAASLTLAVHHRATKTQIKNAVERIFETKVKSVRTVRVLGKPKRSAHGSGRRSSYKKAYIQLKDGHNVDIVDGV